MDADRDRSSKGASVTLFLCGDVMTGRGIDQILPHPNAPHIHESYLRDARGYVELAERVNGPISRPVDFDYVWGDALAELDRIRPDARIVNLETAVTSCEDAWPNKGINYRMHPDNLPCLLAAGIDCCALANNHVLDWGYAGLRETLGALDGAGIKTAGAGPTFQAAQRPAVLELPGKGRVMLFAFGLRSSGIPGDWAASQWGPGVNLLPDLSESTIGRIQRLVLGEKRSGDLVLASIHWGGNWGYAVPNSQRRFARALIDRAGVDIVHGHSSHHPKGIEVYRQRPIIYGCGDLLNDYEGIGGYEAFRAELALMYFVSLEPLSGKLLRFEMTPTRTRRFRINRASATEGAWLTDVLNEQGRIFATSVTLGDKGDLRLNWA